MSSMCIWLVPWTYSQQWRFAVLAQLRWSIQEKAKVPTCPTSSLTRLTTCESCLTTLLAAAPQNGLVSLQKRSVSMRNGSPISSACFWCTGLHSTKWLHLCERWCPQKPALSGHCASAAHSLKFCSGAWLLIPSKVFLCSSSDITSSVLGAWKPFILLRMGSKAAEHKMFCITRRVTRSNKYTAINNPWEKWRSWKRRGDSLQEQSHCPNSCHTSARTHESFPWMSSEWLDPCWQWSKNLLLPI